MRMRTLLLTVLCLLLTIPATAAVKKKSTTCPKTLAQCPDDGCSTDHDVDGTLNELKNVRADDPKAGGAAEPRTLQSMKNLPDPQHFALGGSREELENHGEGTKIRVTAFLLTAKPEKGESCNCGLDDRKQKDKDVGVNTDNHLVLVSGATVKKFPVADGVDVNGWKQVLNQREAESITAEFTPRVRLAHPNFTRAAVRPLILKARQMALPVRVTGLLMFDSQHFLEHPLPRVNNWEIHPILKLEFCPKNVTCKADSDDGWRSLDDL
ncbi:MAG: hypothetical protein DMF56_18080 [Acidobacteria bacterium]|nr:MAG: hypothetical protein DMF56_18080 [Acidobacteriota bacterium]